MVDSDREAENAIADGDSRGTGRALHRSVARCEGLVAGRTPEAGEMRVGPDHTWVY